ncbi:MAG TPA: M23 family metallopeptidase [Gammaproteobacteria bacterium]|nr:M23 family metallopeptidase [Gammaproteobacteria bacterium]
MQLILLSKGRGHLGHVHLTSGRVWLTMAVIAITVCAGAFYAGVSAARVFGVAIPGQADTWKAELAQQQAIVDATRRTLQQNLDALALRLGQMNAHVVRLDALGARLTQMAGLQDGEFDFSSEPPLGGPEEPVVMADTASMQINGIVNALGVLDEQLADRGRQLTVLEDLLLNRKLRDEVHPGGRPVTAGYISSQFGSRTDPFTGRLAFHKGIDFAGRAGADVIAVASGVVTWSGERYGYGQLVEINHGNGYVTRYAHNVDNLVAVGDTVKRGQVIARMGGTGRATGPNLHFEVLVNDRPVDPLTYIGQAR